MTDNPNRQRLNTSIDRLRSALAKAEKTDQRRGVRTGRSNALYDQAVATVAGLTEAIADGSGS